MNSKGFFFNLQEPTYALSKIKVDSILIQDMDHNPSTGRWSSLGGVVGNRDHITALALWV